MINLKHSALLLLAVSASACVAESTRTASEIHDQTLTLDTHIDIPLTYMTEINPAELTDLQVDLPKLAEGKLDSGFWIVYTPQGDLTDEGYAQASEIAETRIAAITALTQTHSNNFELAKTAADVRRIVAAGKHAVLVGMENAYPLGESIESIPFWAERGVRYVGLTHFGHNQFGDSSNPNSQRDQGPKWNGLSPLGQDLVRALNDNGIMVDVSHTGKATMMQAADLSRTPIIASHSGVKAVADTERNLDDEQLLKIKAVNGVAQMVALGAYVKLPTAEQKAARDALDKEFGDRSSWDQAKRNLYVLRRAEITAMAPEANVSDFVDHIDHAVKVAGIDHVGIASDFDGGGGVEGWRDASETENVTAELVRRGYSEGDIAKIWGENLLRVMEAVEADAN
ncbi:membrane dipeptidase [Litorimonas taeanensis]|uniref:Membrane dipeptidase n=1 Tax=Litorimonas taeanensis TaxID=568099 RepID=A0A420WID1_9PROT|nr:dipeptidase [Litorimonas taeanensis]RKQ70716.1 membrane dipeptidase [Litorimonas taeanensis]